MGAWLKGLGLTIWGLIAIGLLAIFSFVGFQAAVRFKSPVTQIVERPSADLPSQNEDTRAKDSKSQLVSQGNPARLPAVPMTGVIHQMFQSAAAHHQNELVIEYGEQLSASGAASAEDMLNVAQSYSSLEDCANAERWLEQADSALRAQGREPSAAKRSLALNCHHNAHVPIAPEHQERINRLLQLLHSRSDADRKRLPQLELEAETAVSGNPSVILGELYYGFQDFAKAIESIRRGLKKGGVVHLDDAYVYLALSEQAEGNVDEARTAFNQLKDVPGIRPRVLKLWMLFAEVELSDSPRAE